MHHMPPDADGSALADPMTAPLDISETEARVSEALPGRDSARPSQPSGDVRALAERVVDVWRSIDRAARRARRTLPTAEEREAAHESFWCAMSELFAREPDLEQSQLADSRAALREILNPWLLRSAYWNRSFTKPHGYAGDFQMLEWMYDLEDDPCADPTKPALVNVLDGLYASVHSVRAVWDRRGWFACLVREHRQDRGGAPLRVLDVACGGSRYLRDVMTVSDADALAVTFVDQDPTALAFIESWLPETEDRACQLVCAPVRRLPALLPQRPSAEGGGFDVVVSTGLFDYLTDSDARALLGHMVALTRSDGVTAICNFAPDDASRVVKDWVSDWQLVYRDADDLRGLFPTDCHVSTEKSPDGGLVYAWAPGTR